MLNVKDLSYHYPNGEGITHISFKLEKGDHLAFIGESGCGKSTLIKCLYGLMDLDQGSILWKGDKVLGPAYNLVPGYSKFKHLSQEFDLMPFTTAEENIQKFLSRETPEDNQRRSDELISLFELEDVKDQKVKTLSGGQKQRVALAQALANPPELILLDEPFSHIDQFLKHRLRRRLFQFLKSEHITCIFATHDADDVLSFSDWTMILKQGKVIDLRSTKSVYNSPVDKYSASLFGDVNLIDSKAFQFESDQSQILIYPHEVDVEESAQFTGRLKHCYFKGSHYLLELDYNSQTIFAQSQSPFEEGSQVNFEPNFKKIKQRFN
ncbi:ABC transporter ATP-binding protein [Psychroflexus tropicus]|uniref:ABC transporter ATP-binding protein n=1 Tax=Psychroflexus tropicus TaxID=197345 RepID=UPI000361F518|nr:ABC transporter ATP-binding protein [Psychroflexus tropicus]